MKLKTLVATAAIVSSFTSQTFAFYVNVVEDRVAGGAQNSLFTMNGPATSTGKSTAAPLSGWTGGTLSGTGSYYAGDTTPVKWGRWAFTPDATHGGYYDVYATWVNVTSAQDMPPVWTIKNAGSDIVLTKSMLTGGNAWNLLAAGVKLNASTAYYTQLATPGTGASGKRANFDSVAWAASLPTAVTYSGPADNSVNIPLTGAGNDLSWSAGSYNSFFDIFFGTTSGSLTKIGTVLEGSPLTFDLDSQGLVAGTEYFWRVDAGNVGRSTAGTQSSFTTAAVPEPSTVLLGLLGGLGAMWMIRRRSA